MKIDTKLLKNMQMCNWEGGKKTAGIRQNPHLCFPSEKNFHAPRPLNNSPGWEKAWELQGLEEGCHRQLHVLTRPLDSWLSCYITTHCFSVSFAGSSPSAYPLDGGVTRKRVLVLFSPQGHPAPCLQHGWLSHHVQVRPVSWNSELPNFSTVSISPLHA